MASRLMETMDVDRRVLRVVAEVSRPGWGDIQESVCFTEVARLLCLSEARVALNLRAAVVQGLAERTEIRGTQYRHILTQKGRVYVGEEPPLPTTFFGKLKRRMTG